jgi:hypothetical protein
MRTERGKAALAGLVLAVVCCRVGQAAPQTAPTAQTRPASSRPASPVEPVRQGIRCPVTADTQVSFYRGGGVNERLWNYGRAQRLKIKGFEEYVLLKFDTAACRGMTVSRATLYLPKTSQCAPAVIAPSTVSTDWAEGTGTGDPNNPDDPASDSAGGATALRAIHPDKTWAGPGSNLKWVVFSEGGSAYDARAAGLAREGDNEYVSVDVPLDVAHGVLVTGDSYGICITEEKGQRAFNKSYVDPPEPNHFIHARESGKAAFLVIEGERTDRVPPAPIANPKAEPGAEAGDIVLTWTCPADDGSRGGKVLGYRVYLSTERLAAETPREDALLPRHLTYRPGEPGSRQVFPIYDLKPNTRYFFAVVAYDRAGNPSAPVTFSGRTRESRSFRLAPHDRPVSKGSPLETGPLRLWACPSNSKISPLTGNGLDEGAYVRREMTGDARNGNEVWDGMRHRVVLFAGRNDFAGFQLALQNTLDGPLTDIHIAVQETWRQTGRGENRILEAAKAELFWQWSCKDKNGVYYPDAMLPLDGPLTIPNPANRIEGQKVQALYVDLYVPHETPPGAYVGSILVQADGVPPLTIPIDLTVWDFQLPDTLSFLSNMYSYTMPRFAGPDPWAGVLDMFRLAHRNRLNLKIIPHGHDGHFTNPYMAMEATGTGKNRRIVSFENFDKHYGPLLDGSAFADCPRKGVPVADVTLPIFENFPCSLKDGFTFDPYGTHLDIRKDFTEDYADGFVAVCRQMAEHFRQKGYTKNIFEVVFRSKYHYAPNVTYWLLDEPRFRDDYLAINYFAHLTRLGFADAPNVRLRIDCSRIEEAHGLMNEVDVFNGTMSNLREYYRPMKDLMLTYVPKADGRPRMLWVYGSTNKVDASNVGNRAWSIEAWLFGADGVVPWLAFGPDKAYDEAESAGEAVFYPGKRFGHNGVFGSLRMKAFRDGQQDVECLILLARQLGATRKEMAGLLRSVCQLQGDFVVEHPEAADRISYDRMSPDDLVRLRRTIGYSLHLLSGRRPAPDSLPAGDSP